MIDVFLDFEALNRLSSVERSDTVLLALLSEFYADMGRIEGWSLRSLSERIDSMRYQRTALSREREKPIKAGGRGAAGQGRNYAGDGAQRPVRARFDCGDLNCVQDKVLSS